MVIPSSFCTDLSTDPALAFVSGGYDVFVNLAKDSYELAIDQTNALNNFEVTPLAFNVSFDFDGQLAAFQRPARPPLDLAGLQFQDPGTIAAPAAYVPEIPDAVDAPQFTAVEPVLSFGPRPETPIIPVPVAPPNPTRPVVPLPPDYVLPELPTFDIITLPATPNITIPTFDAAAPVFDIPDIDQEWSFVPEAYTSDLLTDLTAKVREWMQGGTGLPLAIEDALFDRGIARVDESVTRDIQLASEFHSTRGFTEPNGALNGRLVEITVNSQNKRSEINRDLTIRFHEEELTNIRLAITQGVALEGVLINLHLEEQRLLLQAATFLRETALAVLNARVQLFNAQLGAYQTEATVFESRIRAELARVEIYRAQIEGEKVRGELNTQKVQVYSEQIRALQVMADFYKTRVEAVQVETETNRQVILTFQAQVDAYGKRWDAFRSQLDAYRADVDGQKARADIFESQTNAFATRITAWDREQNSRFERERLRIQGNDQSLRVWRGNLDTLLAYVQKEQSRISSVAQAIDAQARMYQADAAVETAASAATDRSFELGLRKEESRTNVALKQAEVKIQEALQLLNLLLRAKETQTQVIGQLSASAMSAVNFSAGLSSSQSKGQSCSTSVSWSGEVVDLE